MAGSNFIVRGGADFSDIDKKLKVTQNRLKNFGTKLGKTSSGISKSFTAMADGLGLSFLTLGKFALIGVATRGLVNFGKEALQVASDLAEVQNVVDVTFGAMSEDVDNFADTALKQFGLSELSAKKYASTMGAMLKSSGLTGETMKNMAVNLTELSADMASFYNLQNDAAFEKIQAGIAGETKPLRELGINMTVANLEAYALAQGINKSWQEMTQAEQTLLRYNYLLSVTSDSQGDFARTSGSWANQVKLLKEQWQEFMALIGKALVEILLPVVKFLNKVLEGLIAIAKWIGKIYAMITGKQMVEEANTKISDSAYAASDAETDLEKGIEKAGKAAQKALAPFDEINRLQSNLASGSGGVGSFAAPEINTTDVGDSLADGIKKAREESEKFFPWFIDRWNNTKGLMTEPVTVPAPIFAAIPNPVYTPNWGLDMPPVKGPAFPPIPEPVYKPIWNLNPPLVPAIDQNAYQESLWDMETETVNIFERMKTKTAEAVESIRNKIASGYENAKTKALEHLTDLSQRQTEIWENVKTTTQNKLDEINASILEQLGITEENYQTHKQNVDAITTEIADVIQENLGKGWAKTGENTNKAIETTQGNLQTFGKNSGNIAHEIAKAWAVNLGEGFKTAQQNLVNFVNNAGMNMAAFGRGFLRASAETAKGFVSNMVSGFKAVWDNFKSLMNSIGEKVSGWFSANKEVIVKTAIVGGIVVGGAALAITLPAAIPYAAAALGGLATVPALATGGITDGPTLAMVGDNPGGREVVSPLDDLVGMIQQAVQNAGGNGDLNLTIKIGEDTITQKVISNINRQNRISGKTVITV